MSGLTRRERRALGGGAAIVIGLIFGLKVLMPAPAAATGDIDRIEGPVRRIDAASDLRLAQEARESDLAVTSSGFDERQPAERSGRPRTGREDSYPAGLPSVPRALPVGFIPRMTVTVDPGATVPISAASSSANPSDEASPHRAAGRQPLTVSPYTASSEVDVSSPSPAAIRSCVTSKKVADKVAPANAGDHSCPY